MADSHIIADFIRDLKINLNELAEIEAQKLWHRCEDLEAPVAQQFGEDALSVLNRTLHETYYSALDTFAEALRLTLLGDSDDDDDP